MNTFLATFTISFKYLWRNPVSIAILIFFPIILILILGTALSSYISPDTSLEPIYVAATVENSESAFAEFLKSEEISRFIEVGFVDEETADSMLNDDTADLIAIEKDGEISVKKKRYSDMYTDIGITVIDAYNQIGAAAAIRIINSADYSEIAEISNKEVKITEMPLNNRVPSATDYYSVTMLVMILLYTCMNSMNLFKKGLLSNTGDRVRTSPISNSSHIAGLLAASTATSYLQGMVTFLFSLFVYGAYWGDRIPLVLLTLFAVVLFSQSLGIFLLMLLQNDKAASGATQAIIWTMTFVSKGYSKFNFFGAAEKIFVYTPNSLAHTVIFGAIYGGDESKMMFSLAILFAVVAVLFIISFLLGRRRFA